MKILFTLVLISRLIFSQNFWEPTNGPTEQIINSLAKNSLDHLFAGTENNGIYISTNAGNSWTHLINGLPDTLCVNVIAINSDNIIFIGTGSLYSDSSGVYKSSSIHTLFQKPLYRKLSASNYFNIIIN